jgi:hypothetical protein
MKLPVTKLIGAAALGLLMMLSVSTDAMGQGRNRRVSRNNDRKCGKFVNCHDARDGRWDGRGPRRDGFSVGRTFGRSRRDRDSDRGERRRSRRDRDFDRFDRRRWRRQNRNRF